MKRQRIIGIAALAGFCLSAQAAVLHEESFGCGCKAGEWEVINTGNIGFSGSVTNGVYRAANAGNAPGITIYNQAQFAGGTFSASLTRQSVQQGETGILFGWDRTTLTGYEFALTGNQGFLLRAYNKGASRPPFISTAHSFVNTRENRIAVSHRDSSYSLFCNDVLLATVKAPPSSNGYFGFICGPGDSVDFDNVRITSDYTPGNPLEQWEERFDNSDLHGWSTRSVRGSALVSDGALVMNHTEGGNYSSVLYTEGAFAKKGVRVAVMKKDGDDSGIFGIRLIQIDRSMAPDGSYSMGYDSGIVFGITGSGMWAVYSSKDSTYTPRISPFLRSSGWDTLEIGADLTFRANGKDLGKYEGPLFDYNAIGLIVPPGLTVAFDNFSAGAGGNSSVRFGPARPVGSGAFRLNQSSGARFNPRGRSVPVSGIRPGIQLLLSPGFRRTIAVDMHR